jgi:hypothetical protein
VALSVSFLENEKNEQGNAIGKILRIIVRDERGGLMLPKSEQVTLCSDKIELDLAPVRAR